MTKPTIKLHIEAPVTADLHDLLVRNERFITEYEDVGITKYRIISRSVSEDDTVSYTIIPFKSVQSWSFNKTTKPTQFRVLTLNTTYGHVRLLVSTEVDILKLNAILTKAVL